MSAYKQTKTRADVKRLAQQVVVALLVLLVAWYVLRGMHLFVTISPKN